MGSETVQQSILFIVTKLWLPDFSVRNAVGTDPFLYVKKSQYALLESNGWVNVVYGMNSLITRCSIDSF